MEYAEDGGMFPFPFFLVFFDADVMCRERIGALIGL
jgi:hypothetical protein